MKRSLIPYGFTPNINRTLASLEQRNTNVKSLQTYFKIVHCVDIELVDSKDNFVLEQDEKALKLKNGDEIVFDRWGFYCDDCLDQAGQDEAIRHIMNVYELSDF